MIVLKTTKPFCWRLILSKEALTQRLLREQIWNFNLFCVKQFLYIKNHNRGEDANL
jgi:hypothetical protein